MLAVIVIFLAVLLAPETKTLTSFDGRTESLSYWPGNRDAFFVEFDSAWVERARLPDGSPSAFEGRCIIGLVVAGDPGKLLFERLHTDLATLVISTDAATQVSLTSPSTPDGELVAGPLFIHLRGASPQRRRCSVDKPIRLPIEGLVQIGGEDADETGKLLAGVLTVFGRAEPGVISTLAGEGGTDSGTVIYSAGALELPTGSRVGNEIGHAFRDDQSNHWIGYLEANLSSDEPGFSAKLQTAARQIKVWNQAAEATEPDNISMGLTARLAGDPYFQLFIGILAASLAVISILAQRIPVE